MNTAWCIMLTYHYVQCNIVCPSYKRRIVLVSRYTYEQTFHYRVGQHRSVCMQLPCRPIIMKGEYIVYLKIKLQTPYNSTHFSSCMHWLRDTCLGKIPFCPNSQSITLYISLPVQNSLSPNILSHYIIQPKQSIAQTVYYGTLYSNDLFVIIQEFKPNVHHNHAWRQHASRYIYVEFIARNNQHQLIIQLRSLTPP